MKSKRLLSLMLLCFAFIGVARADLVEIGDGGTTNNSYLPGYNFFNYSLTQQIYTADEIGMAGTINSIAFKNTGTEKTRTYNVYMLLTDKETFSSNTDWVAMSDDDLVFSGSLTFTVGEWTTIALDTPFAYNGSSNLLVGVSDVTGGYSSSPHMACLVFSATSQAIRAYRDTPGAYDITAPGVSGTVMNVKNQIQLDITPSGAAVCYKPTLAVSGITHNEATLTVDGGSGTYNVQYKAASATTWTNVATNSTNTTFPISGLTPLTAYDVQAQSVCEGGATSDWKTASFSTTAQAEAVGDAWSDDFEGNACGWELVNGTCADAWVWGTATNNGGTHALYISDDGGASYHYSHNSIKVLATKLLNFTEGKFEFSYDWNCYGEGNYDFLRVALVPASQTLTAGSDYGTITTTSLPTGWIALDGGKLNQVQTWQNKVVAVNVAAGNYYLVLAWRSDTSTQNQPPAAVDNVSITKVACEYNVTELAVSNITTNSATLNWEGGEATQWQVAYGTTSSFEGATEEIVDNNTYEMIGLQTATTYYVRVRAFCGGEDFGSWSDPLQFNTDCEAIPALGYQENFDGITIPSAYTPTTQTLPICWNAINTCTHATYKYYPTVYYYSSTNYASSTPNSLRFYSAYSSYSDYDPQDQYAILPLMENLAGKQIALKARGYNASSTFKIGLMTDPTDATTFTEIATQNGLTTSYQEFSFMIPADATANYVAIMIEAANSSRTNNGVYIDDITIDLPSCFKPIGLVASNPTAHGATLNWNLTDETQTAWDVEVSDTTDFSRVVAFYENVNSHVNYLLTGLNPETQYYVHVRGNCGAEDGVSEWSSPANFTTTIACPAPTGLAASDISAYLATLNWTGSSESYTVSYRTAAYTDGIGEGFGTSLPTGWENKVGLLSDVMEGTALTTGSQWMFGSSNGVFDQHARINIYGYGSTERHGWLISPAFTVVENASLTFDLALTAYSGTLVAPATSGTDDKFVVLITTDNETTWTILRQWDNEEGSTYVYNNINCTAEGEQVSIDLSSYAGQSVRIAFYGESTVSNADNNLHIDNVHCGVDYEAGQWQTVTVDEATAILTDLTPETIYEAKVQGDCGDDGLSLETNIISFTTLNTCPLPTNLTVVDSLLTATTADLSWNGSIDVDSYTVRYRVLEHIEGGIDEAFGGTSIPSDWTMYTGLLDTVMVRPSALTHATYGWAFGENNGVFDSHARVNIYNNYQRWLVTPAFTLSSGTFTFDMALTKYSGTLQPVVDTLQQDDKFIVLISTDNMNTWTILREWNNSGSSYVYNNITCSAEGEQVSIDLSAYVGQTVRIAFYGESTNPEGMANTGGDNNLHIDNVIIGNPTTVPTGEWQTASATATNVTLTGLTPITPYEAQVKSDCSDPEEWSNVVTFTTPVLTTVTQTIALAAGANYFSTSVEITLDDLKAALVEALPGTTMSIKAKTGGTATYNGTRWRGGPSAIDLTKMYIITVTADCEITLEGMPIDPNELPIAIEPGSNWIAYPFNENMTLANAFAGFAVSGDAVKSKIGGTATYNGTRWRGSFSSLVPGQGYIYNSAAETSRTLTYPTNAK